MATIRTRSGGRNFSLSRPATCTSSTRTPTSSATSSAFRRKCRSSAGADPPTRHRHVNGESSKAYRWAVVGVSLRAARRVAAARTIDAVAEA